MRQNGTVAFVSELESGRWSACDNLTDAARFIAEPDYLAANRARPIERRWSGGDERIKRLTKNWAGEPVWGTSRNTWVKYRVPRMTAY
jgi:hypothetical protein